MAGIARPIAAAAWPLAARVQQGEQMRHIGVLKNVAADDPDQQASIAAFLQVLQQLSLCGVISGCVSTADIPAGYWRST